MGVPKTVQRIRLRQVRDGRITFHVERITSPAEVFFAVEPTYRGADREILSVLCLDSRSAPNAFHVAAVGGLNVCRATPADVLRAAVLANAAAIILVHNHVSNVLEPSDDDLQFTRSIARACSIFGIELFDHIIVGDSAYTSLRQRGLL